MSTVSLDSLVTFTIILSAILDIPNSMTQSVFGLKIANIFFYIQKYFSNLEFCKKLLKICTQVESFEMIIKIDS